MMDDLHINNELPVSSGEGWMQMELLLNRTLPVKNKIDYQDRVFSLMPAFLFCSIFIFSSLKLDNQLLDTPFEKSKTLVKTDVTTAGNKSSVHLANHQQPANIIRQSDDFVFDRHTKLSFETEESLNGATGKKIDNLFFIQNNHVNRNNIIFKIKPVEIPKEKISSAMAVELDKKIMVKKPWEFSAGVGMNFVTGNPQNLKPYPVAEIKKYMSKNVFVAAGLSLFSPLAGDITGVSKTIFINDTANNLRQYDEVVRYDRLQYADIPLTVGVNINKKIMIQTGMQLSVLMSKRKSKHLYPYDFQMNRIDLPYATQLVGMAANPQQEFDVQARNFDYRFTAGIKYKINNATTGLFYQRSFEQPVHGNSKATASNQLFTLSLLWKIK